MIEEATEDFPTTIDIAEDGIRTVVLVENRVTAEVRKAYLKPEDFAGQDWNVVVSCEVDRLRHELGYVKPPHYSSDEFLINCYYAQNEDGERDTVLVIEHQPTGRTAPPISCKQMTGRSQGAAREAAMEQLIAELRAAGIPPQPKREGKKRLGKPRWNREG
jgi:hypothetical protein